MGSQAIGSFVWGLLASHTSLRTALVVSAAALVVAALTLLVLPVHQLTLNPDRTISVPWPDPVLALGPQPTDGPVQVDITYVVPAENHDAFVTAMTEVGRSRRRTGAQRWRLWQDGEHPDEFHEVFNVASWSEHLRQHQDRLTGYDAGLLTAAQALTDPEPQVRHLFPAHEGPE
jgi:hypothetical protein